MTKRISLVVTYDTETEKTAVDLDASTILFPEGPCWDGELDRWVDDPGLVDEVTRRLVAQLRTDERSTSPDSRAPMPVETKFIELALNIIDPDGAWDPEEALEFADAARVYLSEYPITSWEIEGAFALVAQFVHDWALSEARGYGESAGGPALATSAPTFLRQSKSSPTSTSDVDDIDFAERMSLETEDPFSGATLRMFFGDFEGVPTLALFVGEDEEPILIDHSALQIAIDLGSDTRNGRDEPSLSFRANADRELEVIHLDIDVEPTFE